ncbi:MAG: metal ABC transporter substrate-binding protein [Eubacteriales bacterium]|nr:metal ABC transporter substrate-binding protein [Eubacteriales bacterium]MDY3332277.1 metal ABC transporter substrate-binding protein [Gallibacter sp.]
MSKKIIAICMCLLLTGSVLVGCGSKDNKDKIKVVTTVFPVYDWTKNVIGADNKSVDVDFLMKNGVDLHSYQATAEDIAKIADSDVLIYVGGESEEWVEDAVKESKNKNLVAINLMKEIGDDNLKKEEVVEGMQKHEHHDDHDKEHGDKHKDKDHDEHADKHHDDHDKDKHDEHSDEPENDEHIWMSLKMAAKSVNIIEKKLSEVDKDNKAIYEKNAKKYTEELETLDKQYAETTKNATNKTIVVADRFPFRYLTDDYGIKYYAAFVGCSAETEASFETITFLANKINKLALKNIVVTEGTNNKIAETVKKSTKLKNQKILKIDSFQSISEEDVKKDISYIDVMKKNLETLKEALK